MLIRAEEALSWTRALNIPYSTPSPLTLSLRDNICNKPKQKKDLKKKKKSGGVLELTVLRTVLYVSLEMTIFPPNTFSMVELSLYVAIVCSREKRQDPNLIGLLSDFAMSVDTSPERSLIRLLLTDDELHSKETIAQVSLLPIAIGT
jgi:hypothetical protein